MDNKVALALTIATAAHEGQKRKYTGEPYIMHPIEVMGIVMSVPHNDDMLAAALLHDTIEDTALKHVDLLMTFGASVAGLVFQLTDQCHEGNRATRKAAEAQRLATISGLAQTIKLADLISNTKSIVERDPDFAKVYLREKAAILDVMNRGDARLYAQAKALVDGAS